MTRKECLDAAAGCVLKDRNRDYGGPEDSFGLISSLWSAYLGVAVDRVDVAMMMGMLKMARIRGNKGYADGFVDLAGYAACAAECAGIKPKADEEPKFKHGDKVQCRVTLPSVSDSLWVDGEYVRYAKNTFRPHVIHAEDTLLAVNDEDIRPAPKAEGCEEPEFKRGDKVEVQMAPDSSTWASATIMAVYRDKDTCEWRCCVDFEDDWGHVVVPSAQVRPVSAPKAEGCEELVQDAAKECRDCSGFRNGTVPEECEGCMKTVESDAPQTKEEVLERIRDVNPAIFKGFSE